MLVNACKESQGREPILTPINLVEPWPWSGLPQIPTGWSVVAAHLSKDADPPYLSEYK